MIPRFQFLSLLILLMLGMYALASETVALEVRSFDLGNSLELRIPLQSKWLPGFQIMDNGTAKLDVLGENPSMEKFSLFIFPQAKLINGEALKTMLSDNGQQLVRKSLEQKILFKAIPQTNGFYYILTDKAPKPGDPALICRGALALDKNMLVFTILFNEKESSFQKTIISCLGQLRIQKKK